MPALFLIAGLWIPLSAQVMLSDDVVHLKNGSIIKGRILSQEEGKIRIELLGGSILVYAQEEVEMIRQEPSPYRKIKVRMGRAYQNREATYREPGIYHVVSIDWCFNQSEWNSVRLDPHAHYAAGYHFNRYVNLGIGTGLDPYESGLIIPWYVDFRGDLWQRKLTPTYYVQAGYGFTAVNGWQVSQMRAGIMLSAGAGWKINTSRKAEWMITLGYKMQHTYQERFAWGGWGWNPDQSLITGTRQYRKIVIGCSLGF
jgi:hypothetical protein